MALTTMVGILEARTETVVGTGTLVRADGVLVHPPLSRELAREEQDSGALRVCVATWGTSRVGVELVDVARVEVGSRTVAGVARRERQVLVGLYLATPSSAPVARTEGWTAGAVAALLENPHDDRVPRDDDPPDDERSSLCKLLGIFCPAGG